MNKFYEVVNIVLIFLILPVMIFTGYNLKKSTSDVPIQTEIEIMPRFDSGENLPAPNFDSGIQHTPDIIPDIRPEQPERQGGIRRPGIIVPQPQPQPQPQPRPQPPRRIIPRRSPCHSCGGFHQSSSMR